MIELVAYDPQWPSMFDLESRHLRSVMGACALRVEHVGSTAVPGLAAKLKQSLAAQFDGQTHASRESYSLAKSAFVEGVLAQAMAR